MIWERYWFIGLALFVQDSGYRLYLEKDPFDIAALFIPQSPLQSKGDRIINILRCEALQWRCARCNEADRLLPNIHKCTWPRENDMTTICTAFNQIFRKRLLRNVEQISITSQNPAVSTGRKYRKHVTSVTSSEKQLGFLKFLVSEESFVQSFAQSLSWALFN